MLRKVFRGDHVVFTDGCDKIAYTSKAKAVKAHRTTFSRRAGRMKPYKCGFCKQWHVTTCRS